MWPKLPLGGLADLTPECAAGGVETVLRASAANPSTERLAAQLVHQTPQGPQAGILIGPHSRSSRFTRFRDGPAFFTALFTLAFDCSVFFGS
jgi:hypothetical protein